MSERTIGAVEKKQHNERLHILRASLTEIYLKLLVIKLANKYFINRYHAYTHDDDDHRSDTNS